MYIYIIGCRSHGQIRIVDGNGPNLGRLEICINGDWGTVCDDMWSHTNAQVVCRQLGYSTDGDLLYKMILDKYMLNKYFYYIIL